MVDNALGLLLAATLVLACSQKVHAIETPRQLARYCERVETGVKGTGRHIRIPRAKEALLCWGYMEAMQDLSVITNDDGIRIVGSCPPEHATLLQLIHTFVAYARSHPKELRGNTAVMVIRALQQAYPCPQAKSDAASSMN